MNRPIVFQCIVHKKKYSLFIIYQHHNKNIILCCLNSELFESIMSNHSVIHRGTGVISGFPVSALTTLLAASSPISVRVHTVALPICGSMTGTEQKWELPTYLFDNYYTVHILIISLYRF